MKGGLTKTVISLLKSYRSRVPSLVNANIALTASLVHDWVPVLNSLPIKRKTARPIFYNCQSSESLLLSGKSLVKTGSLISDFSS